jgi:arylformamidase
LHATQPVWPELNLDFTRASSLARVLNFNGPHPQHFGAPRATSAPLRIGSFEGNVTRGGSCNCNSIHLIPHCHGTHTESASHLTIEQRPLHEFMPLAPMPALLLTVQPTVAGLTDEDAGAAASTTDLLITLKVLQQAWQGFPATNAKALLLRITAAYEADHAPYFTTACMTAIVARGVEHLVVDLPSVDRMNDGGHLAAHRIFFGLAAGETRLPYAQRPESSITELALFSADLPDGPCALQLQLAAFYGDAVPSRPIYIPYQRT